MKRRQANKIGNMLRCGTRLAWKPKAIEQSLHVILRSACRAVRTWVLCGVPKEREKAQGTGDY